SLAPWWKITWGPKLIPALFPDSLYVGHRLDVDPTWIGPAVLAIGVVSSLGGVLLASRPRLVPSSWVRIGMAAVGAVLVGIALYAAVRGNSLVNNTVIPYAGSVLAALAGGVVALGAMVRSNLWGSPT